MMMTTMTMTMLTLIIIIIINIIIIMRGITFAILIHVQAAEEEKKELQVTCKISCDV